jgi:hypothetical protein
MVLGDIDPTAQHSAGAVSWLELLRQSILGGAVILGVWWQCFPLSKQQVINDAMQGLFFILCLVNEQETDFGFVSLPLGGQRELLVPSTN